MPKRYSEYEHNYILKNYPKKTPKEIAEHLGIKKCNLTAYAYRHGISNNRYWTKEQEEYLLNKYGMMTAERIGKKLGKTKRQVVEKAKLMKIGGFLNNCDKLCLSEVCRLVKRDKETIKKTWFGHGLKWVKKGRFTIISPEDLFEFMKTHPKYWDATEIESYYFEEFDWFREKRLVDRKKKCDERWGGIA